MPDTIEISTKLIALITAVIALVSALIALRRKNDSTQNTLIKDKTKNLDATVWEMFRFFAAFIALGFLFFGAIIGFRWMILVFSSIK